MNFDSLDTQDSAATISADAAADPMTAGGGAIGTATSGTILTAPGGAPWVGPEDRLEDLFAATARRFEVRPAVDTGTRVWTYAQVDEEANRLARVLMARGVKPGDRVGLLLDRSIETYVGLLAVLRAKAAYVPLATAFPPDRIAYILADSQIGLVVSVSMFDERLATMGVPSLTIDTIGEEIAAQSPLAPTVEETGPVEDTVCYILYTSGTTGNPKGVVIEHPSICNFVRVAAATYGYRPDDRVYQGMTVAFDFSVEETWAPFMAGCTIVPGPAGTTLLGEELADYLRSRAITFIACSPTLLSTIESDVPLLRILLVGGEACPHNLVVRWYRAGRRILNSYGPTEATVTATLTELVPDKPVTIGTPLPSYAAVILHPTEPVLMPDGEQGEIGLAGICLARGYLNRPDLTAQKFIPDFAGIPHNPSARIYRTGDLGRINAEGEIEYQGRIDTQVKIRGHRIELGEIESVLLDHPKVAQAAVTTFEPVPGQVELVGYFAPKTGLEKPTKQDLVHALKARLPDYMVPAFLEELDVIPMTVSNKADHRRLPPPKGARLTSERPMVAPSTPTQEKLAAVIAEVLRLEAVSVEDHFFDELGANSLLMARVTAKLRALADLPPLSMRDVYLNPTVARLAAHVDALGREGDIAEVEEAFHTPSVLSYWTCGALQLGFYLAYGWLMAWAADIGLEWIYDVYEQLPVLYMRAVLVSLGGFFGLTALSIALKWALIGRWKAERIPIWSLAYFRFWVVATMTRLAPVTIFRGSPLYSVYLQLLGAKIGRNVVLECRTVPVCTDMISIGDDTILRKEVVLLGYRGQSNFIHVGPITIGANAFVGEASVLDIHTEIGDGAQLGHASCLQSGQSIPAGGRAHGVPAVPTTADYCPIESVPSTLLQRTVFEAFQLFLLVAVMMPTPLLALSWWEHLAENSDANLSASVFWASLAVVFGSLAGSFVVATVVPRLVRPFLVPGRVYSLYGIHHLAQTLVSSVSNSRILNLLFGDSSAVVHYIRAIGWKLGKVEQTGSNMGTNQIHDNPLFCEIGAGTMVSDGLSLINLHKSASSFCVLPTRVGDRNYLGNDIHYPPEGKTGANVLLATKVMIPIDGPVRENVGLLGAPAFEIPRMVDSDKALIGAIDEATRLKRLSRKNRHNFATILMFLASHWFVVWASLVMWDYVLDWYYDIGVVALWVGSGVDFLAMVVFYALVERASLWFRPLAPKIATIYDPYFWSHERHWKLSDSPVPRLFAGTPFRSLVLRMLGMKVGRMVWDGGAITTERTLVEVGDYANLNFVAVMQAHSLEEGAFKSDRIRIGRGATLAPAAFVHYGTTVGERAVVEPDSFLMKGEAIGDYEVWGGNPAKPQRRIARPAGKASGETAKEA